MELLKFIKNRNYEDIKKILSDEPYFINISEDNDYFILKYNQIKSDFSKEIVRECRGIIVRKADYEIVCHPFHKFFNYGEVYAAKLDWNTSSVQEKIDGSIIKVWYDAAEWHISTNGIINAKNAFCSTGKSFYDLFIDALNFMNKDINVFNYFNKQHIYMFELVHPLNKIVVKYEAPGLFHIGTRDNISGKEIYEDINFMKPIRYNFSTIDEIINTAKDLSYDKEGYVIVDKDFNRIKIKSPMYIIIHHLKDNNVINMKNILSIILNGEQEEFCSYFPEFKCYINEANSIYNNFLFNLNDKINLVRSKSYFTRKEYALDVLNSVLPDFFFQVYDGNYTFDQVQDFLQELGVNKLVKVLKLENK